MADSESSVESGMHTFKLKVYRRTSRVGVIGFTERDEDFTAASNAAAEEIAARKLGELDWTDRFASVEEVGGKYFVLWERQPQEPLSH